MVVFNYIPSIVFHASLKISYNIRVLDIERHGVGNRIMTIQKMVFLLLLGFGVGAILHSGNFLT
jgi:hypothetical protein